MILTLLLILLILALAGGGFAAHLLWLFCVVALIVLLVRLFSGRDV